MARAAWAMSLLLAAGCGGSATTDSTTPAGGGSEAGGPPEAVGLDTASSSVEAASPGELTPVAANGGIVELTPANTSIGFVGAHTDDKPDRVGGFETFQGTLRIDESDRSLKGVTVEIETGSLWTEFGNLTNHLNSPDFFDTREYPTASFESTGVTASDGGDLTITGNLTLHGVSKEISFPAKYQATEAGITLTADFVIDRTQFGMDKLTDGVKPEVQVTVAVGKPTKPTSAAGAP